MKGEEKEKGEGGREGPSVRSVAQCSGGDGEQFVQHVRYPSLMRTKHDLQIAKREREEGWQKG